MRKLYIFLILSIFLISIASAEIAFTIPREQEYDLQFKCTDTSKFQSICDDSTTCNISITYTRNNTIIINNSFTSNLHNGKFNITLNSTQTNVSGEYEACVSCSNTTTNEASCFKYLINPGGVAPSESRTESLTRSIYFMTLIGIILMVAFFFVKNKPPIKWTLFIISFIFFLIAINLMFIGISDEVVNPRLERFFDNFTGISFILYYAAFAFLIILWFVTMINTYVWKKNMENIRRFGGDPPNG